MHCQMKDEEASSKSRRRARFCLAAASLMAPVFCHRTPPLAGLWLDGSSSVDETSRSPHVSCDPVPLSPLGVPALFFLWRTSKGNYAWLHCFAYLRAVLRWTRWRLHAPLSMIRG